MRLAGISDIAGANNWLPGFVASFNRRFAVIPKDAVDAHIAYPGSADELTNILSIQIAKTLSKNLSFQHECNLIQVKASGTGLAMRGAKVTLHDHLTEHGCYAGEIENTPIRHSQKCKEKQQRQMVKQSILG